MNNRKQRSSDSLSASIAVVVALRLHSPPGSRMVVRRKTGPEQAGIGKSPPFPDVRRSFYTNLDISRFRLTAPDYARHSWMLDVVQKMPDCRASARLCTGPIDTFAQLRNELQQLDPGADLYADNLDRDAHMPATNHHQRCMYTASHRSSRAGRPNSVVCPGRIQLQRYQQFSGCLQLGDLVRK
jgi:hypothetical protein